MHKISTETADWMTEIAELVKCGALYPIKQTSLVTEQLYLSHAIWQYF